MPIFQINVKMTTDERKLLAKRAKKQNIAEADYLRMCMVLEAVTAGDLEAVQILGENIRYKLGGLFDVHGVKSLSS